MITNFIKIALRNLGRNKWYSFINITGLSVGMACCILLLLWVRDDLSFDKFHKNSDKIYRVITQAKIGDNTLRVPSAPVLLGKELNDEFPEVDNYARYRNIDGFWSVIYNDEFQQGVNIGLADESFFDIFDFEFDRAPGRSTVRSRTARSGTGRWAGRLPHRRSGH